MTKDSCTGTFSYTVSRHIYTLLKKTKEKRYTLIEFGVLNSCSGVEWHFSTLRFCLIMLSQL